MFNLSWEMNNLISRNTDSAPLFWWSLSLWNSVSTLGCQVNPDTCQWDVLSCVSECFSDYACTVIVQGWVGACCMLISLEGYVNVLREECEYITPFHQQSSCSTSSFPLFLSLSLLLPLPSSHFPVIMQTHSSFMKSLKAKSSSPGPESILNISGTVSLRLQRHEYKGQFNVLWSALIHMMRKIIRRGNIIREHYSRLHIVTVQEADVPT